MLSNGDLDGTETRVMLALERIAGGQARDVLRYVASEIVAAWRVDRVVSEIRVNPPRRKQVKRAKARPTRPDTP